MERAAPTLLVIEDAQDQALLVGHAARRCHPGLTVHVTSNGFDGTAYLAGIEPFEDRRHFPAPNLVILDLFMPEVDGFSVLAWKANRPELADLPIVVLTGSPKPEDEAKALQLGANGVFRKPGELDALAEVVKEIVQTYIPRSAMMDAWMTALG